MGHLYYRRRRRRRQRGGSGSKGTLAQLAAEFYTHKADQKEHGAGGSGKPQGQSGSQKLPSGDKTGPWTAGSNKLPENPDHPWSGSSQAGKAGQAKAQIEKEVKAKIAKKNAILWEREDGNNRKITYNIN